MTAYPDFTITDLAVIDGKANDSGNRLLASFNLSASGVVLKGCVLIEKASGVVRVGGPDGKTTRGVKVGGHITDPVLYRAVTRRAAVAYGALTGREVCDE